MPWRRQTYKWIVPTTVRVPAGASVAIIGGAGLAPVQGARIVGASKIVAVDAQSWKFDLARKLGATDCVDPAAGDSASAVQDRTVSAASRGRTW